LKRKPPHDDVEGKRKEPYLKEYRIYASYFSQFCYCEIISTGMRECAYCVPWFSKHGGAAALRKQLWS